MPIAIILLLLLAGCGPGHGRRLQERTVLVCDGNTGQTLRCVRVSRLEFEIEMQRRGQR